MAPIRGVCLDTSTKKIVNSAYLFHKGDIQVTLKKMLEDFDLSKISQIAVTTSTPGLVRFDGKYDNQVAIISAVKELHDNFNSILSVGGEKFDQVAQDKELRQRVSQAA